MPAANRVSKSVECHVCHKTLSRKADLPRHLRTHDGNKEALMHACPFPGCDYKTLQKSNVQTHIRTHTGDRSKKCPEDDCTFSTTDPGSLTRHRKQTHGYEPKARRSVGGRAARQSAISPYPSPHTMKAEVENSTSMELIDLTFPELAGLITCDVPSPAESSNSGLSHYSGDLTDFSWEEFFPTLPLPCSYDQPSQLPLPCSYDQPSQLPITSTTHLQPPMVPVDLASQDMPAYDAQLLSDVNFFYQPNSENFLNFTQPQVAELEEFMQHNGSGYFEGCGYQHNAIYPIAQGSLYAC